MRPGARRAALLAALLSAAGQAQQAAGPRPPAGSLSAAWLAEHLRHAPRGRLAELYARALDNGAETREARSVAAARLLEIDRVTGDPTAIDLHLAALRDLLGDAEFPAATPLEIDRGALREALLAAGPEREAALREARERIGDAMRDNRSVARAVVWLVVRRLAADRDAERARLERDLSEARAAGLSQRVAELEERLRSSRGGDRSGSVDRLRAWRIRLLRLLSDGRFDQAEVLRDRLPDTRSGVVEEPRQRLAAALADPGLAAQERAALEDFAARLAAWERDARPEAARALRLLPY